MLKKHYVLCQRRRTSCGPATGALSEHLTTERVALMETVGWDLSYLALVEDVTSLEWAVQMV